MGAPFDVVIGAFASLSMFVRQARDLNTRVAGSDVVFKESLVAPLLRSIRAVATERTTVLIALEIRCEELCRSFQRDASVEFLVKRVCAARGSI